LIDAGDPVALTPSKDLDGLSRPVGGRFDLGAFEYQRRAPVASVSATPASASTGQAITFAATASDPDPGDSPLAYSWRFAGGAAVAGAIVKHAFAKSGAHTAKLTVTDPTGKSITAGRVVTIVADHTPPTITLRVKRRLSLAKTLRRGIRVTIGCSEA